MPFLNFDDKSRVYEIYANLYPYVIFVYDVKRNTGILNKKKYIYVYRTRIFINKIENEELWKWASSAKTQFLKRRASMGS